MNIRSRKRQKKVEAEASAIFLPEELTAEVLSLLNVKSLTRLKCVSKSWNTLISDRKFIKLHLTRFSQKADRTLVSAEIYHSNCSFVPFTAVHMLLENPPNNITTFLEYRHHELNDDMDCSFVVGSCNGLICLCGKSSVHGYREWFFRFWNPATRIISEKLGSFRDSLDCRRTSFIFTLGFDKSKDTFKLVCFLPESTNIRILNLTDYVWRNIQDSPLAYHKLTTKPVYLSGSVNWLVIHNYFDSNHAVEQFMIISLDLGTETHKKLLPPQGFNELNEVPFVVPNLGVLKDCLCFSHDFKQTHFIIWQMKEFGVEESWTQLLKVNYHNLRKDYHLNDHFKSRLDFNDSSDFHLIPVCLSEKNGTLLLINNLKRVAILFNWRDNRTELINKLKWNATLDYVESLVLYY